MSKSLLSPAQLKAINTLPLISTQVLSALLEMLYAEPGFSDTEVIDIARRLEMDVQIVKGAIGYLTTTKLVSPIEMDVNNRKKVFVYSDLHSDTWEGSAQMGRRSVNGDSKKAEALRLLDRRLAFLNELIAPSKGGKGVTVAVAESMETMDIYSKGKKVEPRVPSRALIVGAGRKSTPQVEALPGMTPLGVKPLVKGSQEAKDRMAAVRAAGKAKPKVKTAKHAGLDMDNVAMADCKDMEGLLESLKAVVERVTGFKMSILDRGDDNFWVAIGDRVYSDKDLVKAVQKQMETEESK